MQDAWDVEDKRLLEAGEHKLLLAGYFHAVRERCFLEQAVELFEAWQAGESPLLRLRTAQGLKREAVVSALVQTLGLDPKKDEKVKRYYHELESGLLEPERVDGRVWDALAKALSARVSDLVAWRPAQPELPAPAFARASQPMMAASRASESPEEPTKDEIDRLFHMERR